MSQNDRDKIFCKETNAQWLDVSSCPFVIGERISMEREHTGTEVVQWTWDSLPEIVDIQLMDSYI